MGHIEKRPLGDSGIEIAPLALGGNVFGWTADKAASFEVLDAFVDAGGTMIDTADVYSAWVPGHSGGESETIIGEWLKRDPAKRDKVVIATKVGYSGGSVVDGEYVAALGPEAVVTAAEASLRRLGVETIDLYYQHRDDPETPLAESLGAFDDLRRAGKIRAIGLSNFEAPRVEEAVEVSNANGFAKPAALQDRYNLMDRDGFEGQLRQVAARLGIPECPYYGLASGFLTGKYRSSADSGKSVRGGRAADYLESEKGSRVLAALDLVAAETGAAVATVALAWLKAQPGIAASIASARRIEQLDDLVASLHLDLSQDQIERLDRASD